jgi:hypothetical protein
MIRWILFGNPRYLFWRIARWWRSLTRCICCRRRFSDLRPGTIEVDYRALHRGGTRICPRCAEKLA